MISPRSEAGRATRHLPRGNTRRMGFWPLEAAQREMILRHHRHGDPSIGSVPRTAPASYTAEGKARLEPAGRSSFGVDSSLYLSVCLRTERLLLIPPGEEQRRKDSRWTGQTIRCWNHKFPAASTRKIQWAMGNSCLFIPAGELQQERGALGTLDRRPSICIVRYSIVRA